MFTLLSIGYYCPTGSSLRTEQPCPAGHYCAGGNSQGVYCESGYYQDTTGQSTCKICPPGKKCSRLLRFIHL